MFCTLKRVIQVLLSLKKLKYEKIKGDEMKVQELKKLILTSKKDDVNVSKAYAAVLNQVEKATVGVKNPETDEKKLILAAAKKELKEQEQSREAGAPFSETTIKICLEIIQKLDVAKMSERETEFAINALPDVSLGEKMKILKEEYGDMIDLKLANQILRKS